MVASSIDFWYMNKYLGGALPSDTKWALATYICLMYTKNQLHANTSYI